MNGHQKKSIFSLVNILIAFLIVIAAVVVFLWVKSSNNEMKRNVDDDVLELEENFHYYAKAKEEYNAKSINESIDINIEKKFKQKEAEIKKGITKVYAETKTKKAYNQLEDALLPSLGAEFTEKLLKLSKPVVNESGAATFSYEAVNDIKIGFGEYNLVNHTAELFVIVDYESPEVGANNPSVKREDKTVVITGKDLFVLTYNLKEDTLNLKDYKQQMQSEVKSDESD